MLAGEEGLPLFVYLEKYRYSISRLRWLALVIDRVFSVRQILIRLEATSNGWSATHWNIETEAHYPIPEGSRTLTFHGSAILQNRKGRYAYLILEWDNGQLPIRAVQKHWVSLLLSQDEGYCGFDHGEGFPVFVVIGRDAQRTNQYLAFLIELMARSDHFLFEA